MSESISELFIDKNNTTKLQLEKDFCEAKQLRQVCAESKDKNNSKTAFRSCYSNRRL
jgi:hypothetical protein